MKERIRYLDSLKGLSIIMVIYCHYPLIAENSVIGSALMCLASFVVPVFFMVSGGLAHLTEHFTIPKYIKRICHIYLLLVIWKAIYLIISCFYKEIVVSIIPLIKYLFFFGGYSQVQICV